jgi:signal transduction histidine kinase
LTHRAAANKLEIKLAPTDLLKDVLGQCSMLYQRDGGVDVTVDCPKRLRNGLRLKQIMLNLGRNSTKFVHSGFIRFRAAVVDGVEVWRTRVPEFPLRSEELCLKSSKQLGRKAKGLVLSSAFVRI